MNSARNARGISSDMKSFREKILGIVKRIPKNESMTYKEVATRAGNPKAARAVGAIMRTNMDPAIPCYRVVRTESATRKTKGGIVRASLHFK